MVLRSVLLYIRIFWFIDVTLSHSTYLSNMLGVFFLFFMISNKNHIKILTFLVIYSVTRFSYTHNTMSRNVQKKKKKKKKKRKEKKAHLNRCAQRRFRSACAFAQSDQNLYMAHFGQPRMLSVHADRNDSDKNAG